MKGYQAVAAAIAAHGVEVTFGLVGDANLFLVHSLINDHGLRYVALNHEASAVLAADGYARLTGNLGVVSVTHGPGLTNTVTALTEATRSRTPLLLIVGDTAIEARQNPQDIVHRDVVHPTGAGFVQSRGAEFLGEDVALAVRQAHQEQRPVVLNIPVELLRDEAPASSPVLPPLSQVLRPDPEAVDAAVGVLASARRPLIVAGRGAADHRDAVLELAERLGAPVATTLRAKGLFTGADHSLDVMGTLSTLPATEVINEADVLLVLGASLNRYTASNGTFVEGKTIIHVDADPAAIGRWVPVHAGVVGDVGEVVGAMNELLAGAELDPSGFAASAVVARVATAPTTDGLVDRTTDATVDMRFASAWLDAHLPQDRVFATDGGRYLYQTLPHLHLPSAGRFAGSVAFGSIGLGMGMCIGAAVGRPSSTVVGLFGDGGFLMGGLTELATAVRYGLDVIIVVYNDGAFGAEHVQLHRLGMDPDLTLTQGPDLAAVARAVGASAVTVQSWSDLELAAKAIESRDRPLLLDLRVDPDIVSADS